MYDYSRLPTLVLNEIFGYLSLKEQIKCKAVCRAWKEEVELKAKMRDVHVLHWGPYLWNNRWSLSNKLMKYENSFQMQNLAYVKHPLTRQMLKNTKRLASINYHRLYRAPKVSNIVQHIAYLDYYLEFLEEVEIQNYELRGTPLFDLPNLKKLVIKDCLIDRLVLNCESLEVLFWNSEIKEIQFFSVAKLKRIICFGWPARVSLKGKFDSLEYLNMFAVDDERVNENLLGLMPKLKQFVLYSADPQADLKSIREQQKRFGLNKLEVLFSGFSEPVKIGLFEMGTSSKQMKMCVRQLFDNYSKLVESSCFWKVWINYAELFDKFKILPANFVERFNEPIGIEISRVTSYRHLFEFLKCYPFCKHLRIYFSKVNASLILDRLHLLAPSIREICIMEKRPSDVLEIDLAFMRLFNLIYLQLNCTKMPFKFLRKVARSRGPQFSMFEFKEIQTGYSLLVYFPAVGVCLINYQFGDRNNFNSIEELIAFWESDPHLREFTV